MAAQRMTDSLFVVGSKICPLANSENNNRTIVWIQAARFPVHGIKIDRSFVSMMMQEPKHAAIVKTIIAMGRNLNLSVIAEGVETEAELIFLRENGSEEVQGWYFSPALPADEFAEWYQSKKSWSHYGHCEHRSTRPPTYVKK